MEIEGGSATPATAAEESAVTHAYFLPCRGRPGRVAISSRWSWQEIRRFLPAPELCEILKPALTQPSDRAIGVYASKKGANAVNATASRILEWAVTGDVLLLKTRDRDDLPTAVLDITADDVYIMHDFAKDAWVRVLCREPSVFVIPRAFRCRQCDKPYMPVGGCVDTCQCARECPWAPNPASAPLQTVHVLLPANFSAG
eukprot:jgi/Mesvir1/14034/Mv04445-RA.1